MSVVYQSVSDSKWNCKYLRNVSCFANLKPFIKDRKLVEITPEEVNCYFNKRLKDGVKPASVNRERNFLS